MYHGRSKAPIRTEKVTTKEGASAFWAKIAINPNTTTKKKQNEKQKQPTPAQIHVTQSQGTTSTASDTTTITANTNITAKLREQRSEFQSLLATLTANIDAKLKAQNDKFEKAIAEVRETQAEMQQGFAMLDAKYQEFFEGMQAKMDMMAKHYSDGTTAMNTAIQEILARLPVQPASPRRKTAKTNINDQEAYNPLVDADLSQDGSTTSTASQRYYTQEGMNDSEGSRGC